MNIFSFNKYHKFINRYEYYPYLFFRYHNLFFHSLIFRGRKMWAFKCLNNLKYELKIRKKCDPYWILLISWLHISSDIYLFPKKYGSQVQYLPLWIYEHKRYTFFYKWTIKLLKDKYRIVKLNHLIDILLLSLTNQGESYNKKVSTYTIGIANRHLLTFIRRYRKKRPKLYLGPILKRAWR